MAITRINNNQITDASAGNVLVGVNASSKLQNYTITSQKIANNLTYGSDLTITGNLTVQGQTTSIDTTITTIEDPVILLASTQTGSPTVDIGFVGERGTSDNIAFVWDESASEFVTAFTSTAETSTTISISSYANLHTNDANIGGNAVINGTTSLVGNLIGAVNATGNITGGNLRTAGLVSATGNINGGNVIASSNISGGNVIATTTVSAASVTSTIVSASGNITGGNVLTGGAVSATGNITGGNISTAGQFGAASLSASGNITGGNLLTGGLISSTGTITSAANISGANVNATTIVNAPSLTGTIVSVTGNVTGGNVLTGGAVSATGNVNGGNIITTGNVNASQGYFTSNVTVVGTFTSTSNIVANTSGIFFGDAVTGNSAIFAGVPSFTALGTNVVAQFSGNVNSYSQINFENINNGTRASTDYIATADNGNDTTYFIDMGIAGSNHADPSFFGDTGSKNDGYLYVVANAATGAGSTNIGNLILGSTNGNIKMFVGNTAQSSVIQNISTDGVRITGIASATGTITGGNLATAGTISGTGNITGGNLLTGGLISATSTITSAANITGGNINTAGVVSATGTITGGNLATGGTISGTGNITGGNISTTGAVNAATVSTTGNVFVAGNLTVQGNIQYTNVDDLRVEDPVIILGTGPNGAPLTSDDGMDRGMYMEYYKSGALGNAFVGWDNSTGNMVIASSVNFSGNNIVNVVSYGTLQAGNAYLQTASITGNVDGGNLRTAGQVSATGNITGGNISTGGILNATSLTGTTISASGNVTGGNLLTGGLVSATGSITSAANVNGGNIVATTTVSGTSLLGTTVSASGNVTGGNVLTGGLISATGNVNGGNLVAATTVSAPSHVGTIVSVTGNVTGGNVLTGGLISATGNINGGNLIAATTVSGTSLLGTTISASGNVTGGNVISSALVQGATVSATGNVVGGNVNTAGLVSATGTITSASNISGANVNATTIVNAPSLTGTIVSVTGNVTGGNVLTGGLISATGNVNGGNVISSALVQGTTVSATGNVVGGNVNTAGLVSATGNLTGGNINTAGLISATGNIRGGNLILTSGIIDGPAAGRITINGSDIDVDFAVDGDTVANVFYVDAGTGTASFGSSTQTTNAIVAFNASNSVLMPVGNTAQRPGTGVTGMLRFNTTSNSLEIYDNSEWSTVGVPAFTVISDEQFSGDGACTIFTLSSSQTTNSCIVSINGIIQIPVTAYAVSGAGGNVLTFTEAPQVGDLIDVRQITTTTTVTGISNSTGNAAITVSDTSNVVLVTGQLSATGGIVGLQSDQISSGTSNVRVVSSGGNVTTSVAGTSNVMVVSSTGVEITGNLSVTGNATLSGNILGDRIQNGTTTIDIQTPSGNANVTVSGTSNVAVFTTTGVNITGVMSASGNVTGGNVLTGGLISATGSITSAGNISGANIIATTDVYTPEIVKTGSNAVGNIGQASNYFNTVFATATSALYADLAEKYTADDQYPAGTVVIFGGSKEVTVSSADADRRVAGVVSTNPSYIMNAGLEAEHVVTVALTGRVPTRVTGTVRKGDLMVSAGYGLARAEADPRVGTVIGKALEDFDGNEGVIEVVVGRF